jgi:hypothetical protein
MLYGCPIELDKIRILHGIANRFTYVGIPFNEKRTIWALVQKRNDDHSVHLVFKYACSSQVNQGSSAYYVIGISIRRPGQLMGSQDHTKKCTGRSYEKFVPPPSYLEGLKKNNKYSKYGR